MKDDGIASILKKEHKDRIRDHLRREGWSEFTVRETFAAIGDEFEVDPEGGAFLFGGASWGGSEGEPLT